MWPSTAIWLCKTNAYISFSFISYWRPIEITWLHIRIISFLLVSRFVQKIISRIASKSFNYKTFDFIPRPVFDPNHGSLDGFDHLTTPGLGSSKTIKVICSHFQACRHVLCPEEFSMLKNRALQTAKFFFDKMALEGKKLLIHLYNAKIALTDDLYPSKAAELLLNNDRHGFISYSEPL